MHPLRDFAEPVLATHLAQLGGVVVLTVLLVYFHRLYSHAYLRQWALSFGALTVYLVAISGILITYGFPDTPEEVRLALTLVALAFAYPHLIWLMTGAWTAGTGKELDRRIEWLWVGTGVTFGIATALVAPLEPDQVDIRLFFRTALRYGLSGTAFLVAGIFILAAMRREGLIGPRVLALAFIGYGLQLLHITGVFVVSLEDLEFPAYLRFTGLVEFFAQMMIGLGLVIWLLELERREVGQTRSRLNRAGRFDAVTGLPNRQSLLGVLAKTMRQARRTGRKVAVLSLGMDRYAAISQSLGWRTAEQLVERAARRLQSHVYPGEILGRAGDNQFLLLVPDAHCEKEVFSRAETLVQAMSEPFVLRERELYLGMSAGVSIYPDHGLSVETLIARAEEARLDSRNRVQLSLLGPEDDSAQADVLKMESDLRRGWREYEFEMYYQPICKADNRRIVGLESLLRWNHPTRGLLTPGQFLPVAEGVGVLDEFEGRIMERSTWQLAEWQQRTGREDLVVSVNLSAHHFQNPDLIERARDACRRAGLRPDQLHLEITENAAMQDMEAGHSTVRRLVELGFGVSLDDFGTGFSSLSYLRRLPAQTIKLDRSFLEQLDRVPAQRELIHATIALVHSLGKKVVVEGVETREHLEFLVNNGCDLVQGFYLHRPMDAHGILDLIREEG